MNIKLLPASRVDFGVFTQLLNDTYADYYVPLNMNVDQLRERVQRDDISLAASQVALMGSIPIGLGMLALHDTLAWLGGVGVLPAYRRQGVGRALMDELLDAARSSGAEHIQLEVIQQNERAYKLYDSLGFEARRKLYVAEGRASHQPHGYNIQTVSVREALRYFDAFHPVPNPWQRRLLAIDRMGDYLRGLVAMKNGQVLAYVIGVFRRDVIRFVDLAHAPEQKEALKVLVGEVHRRNPFAVGSIINVADDDPAWAILSELGYEAHLTQFEMHLKL